MARETKYTDLLKVAGEHLKDAHKLSPSKQEQLIQYTWEITVKACREDFYTFVKTLGPVLIPGFKTGTHIEIICEELQKLYEAIQWRTVQTTRPRN
jgi:hypothetical protein